MDSRNQNSTSSLYPPSPSPIPPVSSSSSIFQNVSNLRTPQIPRRNHGFEVSPRFITASKRTPLSLSRSSVKKSKAARRLKAIEVEQSKSARKVQLEKEKSLKSLARSLTVWLNFLFENPGICGCNPDKLNGEITGTELGLGSNGKRGSGPSSSVGVEGPWRGPKRLRDSLWRGEESAKNVFSDSMFVELNNSLKEICSFEDLKERMRMYLKLDSCKEIFEAMTQVTKNIDEGRLKMRPSCPIVSDVGMKEKAVQILMCYNPVWLRIGFYIILGGESLLQNDDVNSEQENAFLRMVLEKQFLSHSGLAKAHAYNKMVEGLYRPGYYEKLGNVILKRFLLLVIILDRAKSQTSLPTKYGIDGLDGGSPLLFSSKYTVKSSRQLVTDFLSSDVMHGEGNVLAHLGIIGYKVTYQQNPLIEFEFKITDLFKDLQDGIRLCRAIQLLTHDSSILLKVVVPSDTQKKSLANVSIGLQYLKQAGVPLFDEDGTEIIAEDVVNGDKELVLSFLWNMFIHLQLPLLTNKTLLSKEISSIRGNVADNASNQTPLNLVFCWIQAICDTYELKVENHSFLLDGKAMWCLLDYYFRKDHDCSCASKDSYGIKKQVSIMSAIEYTDAVHNFLLSQKLSSLLGNFPEVLQVSDILENKGACNEKSVIVLLVFLSVQLLVKRNMDKLNYHKLLGFSCENSASKRFSMDSNNEQDPSQDFRTIMAWWQDMAHHNGKCTSKPFSIVRKSIGIQRENAALIIQSHHRRLTEQRKYTRKRNAALLLQKFAYSWMIVKKKLQLGEGETNLKGIGLYTTFLADRYYFVSLKQSSKVIQQAIRGWIARRRYDNIFEATSVIQSYIRGCLSRSLFAQREIQHCLKMQAAINIQKAWKIYLVSKSIQRKHNAATKIQSHYHGWLIRRTFTKKKVAVRKIKTCFLYMKMMRESKVREEEKAATTLQSHFRRWMARKEFLRKYNLIVNLQRFCRGWLHRKNSILHKDVAIKIQAFVRGEITRRRLSGLYCCHKGDIERNASVVVIQSHFRGYIVRKVRERKKQHAVLIQARWRGYVARKHAKTQQLAELRSRMEKSAANVDESRKLINRLIAAVCELLRLKSVSNILHTCATLDMATELSQKCCEELVAAGAINVLLKLIRSVSRSIPDQQVLKHALSTLRNLARYPQLARILIQTPGCMETVVMEFLKNKDEGYFIASDLLKKMWVIPVGASTVRASPPLLRRLDNIFVQLSRKAAANDRRTTMMRRESKDDRLRLKEVVELRKLISHAA